MKRSVWRYLLLLCPFLIGIAGLTAAGEPVLQAVYQSLCMYGMGFQSRPANLLVELARWLAPLATAGGVMLAVGVLRRRLRAFGARCTGHSVAVYGPVQESGPVLEQLGRRGIPMGEQPVKAHNYILLGGESENLDYYHRNRKVLDKGNVWLKCSSLPAQAGGGAGLHLFCPEETAARLFWKRYCPYELSCRNGHRLSIVLLGFEKLGQEVLLCALQNNIFDAGQQIEYHVFGAENGFTGVYRQLKQLGDPVVFHEGPWQKELPLLEQAHMVVCSRQADQLALLSGLTLALPGKPVYVLAARPEGTELLARQGGLICFDWQREVLCPDHIMEDRLSLYAKHIHLRYAHLYQGVEESREERERQWQALDAFTRYSNISAADHHYVQLLMLGEQPLTAERLEWLAELEHIRWCRFHWLNNWTLGEPENGANKDLTRRIHRLLIPYEQLAEEHREKDRENIRVLLALDRDLKKGDIEEERDV